MYALKDLTFKLYMKIDNEKFIDVGKIVDYYNKDFILKLVNIHEVTGCDTTSYLHGM